MKPVAIILKVFDVHVPQSGTLFLVLNPTDSGKILFDNELVWYNHTMVYPFVNENQL